MPVKAAVKQIQVFAPGYRSRKTATQLIAPGVYPADSPELFGAAEDIVSAGAGQWVTNKAAVKALKELEELEGDDIEQLPTREDIETLSKEQLIIMARQLDLGKPATGDTKDEWKQLIFDHFGF